MSDGRTLAREVLRASVALGGAALCVWAMWYAWRTGSARTYAELALSSDWVYETGNDPNALLFPANKAVWLASADPFGHYARAVLLDYLGRAKEATAEAEATVARAPRYFLYWLKLGETREHAGDLQGAQAAYVEAVRLAPAYSKPHFQLGNLLLRMGKTDEAFAELRRASASAPSLLPYTIQLAWNAYKGDVRAVVQAIQPRTDSQRIAVARFLAQQSGANIPAELLQISDRSKLLIPVRRDLVSDLVTAKRFNAAFDVWAALRKEQDADAKDFGRERITDGGFERAIELNAVGFDWRLANERPDSRVTLDAANPHSGAYSLRVEYDGDSAPNLRLITQLVVVQPNTRYLLTFFVRAENVVSGGMPVVAVFDAGTPNAVKTTAAPAPPPPPEKLLGQSKPFASNSNGQWQEYTVAFTTPANCEAVIVALQRQPCNTAPCPIFGRIWLDDFSLKRE
jgi:tetratricopeptide (TPR) repeat protein